MNEKRRLTKPKRKDNKLSPIIYIISNISHLSGPLYMDTTAIYERLKSVI